MPYYCVEIRVPVCPEIGCKRAATFEVRLPTNEVMGRWCKPHAERRVEDMNDAAARERQVAAGDPCWIEACVLSGPHDTHRNAGGSWAFAEGRS